MNCPTSERHGRTEQDSVVAKIDVAVEIGLAQLFRHVVTSLSIRQTFTAGWQP
jgi:hypothetical protein